MGPTNGAAGIGVLGPRGDRAENPGRTRQRGGGRGAECGAAQSVVAGVAIDVDGAGATEYLTQTVRFLVLLNALIPISLYVTLELVKVMQDSPGPRHTNH